MSTVSVRSVQDNNQESDGWMRIGVVSDTHGDVEAWDQAWEYLKTCDYLIHAGDVLYHGPRNPIKPGYNPAQLAQRINNCGIPLLIARGNCDAEVDQLMLEFPVLNANVLMCQGALTLLANHGHTMSREDMVRLAQKYHTGIFIFGHIHQPVLEQQDQVILLNPGSCSLPKESPATIAIIEEQGIRIVEIETGKSYNELRF